MALPQLIHLGYSPWSEKARWALDLRQIRYTSREYLPMLGEPLLRYWSGRWTGKVTVPMLLHGRKVISDSFAIAQFAEQFGLGAPLFAGGAEDPQMASWNARSEAVLSAGRTLVLQRILNSPAALRENTPKWLRLPGLLGTLLAAIATRFLARKYKTSLFDSAAIDGILRDILKQLRAALADERACIFLHFSYADMAMAVALQVISPQPGKWMRLGPASRVCWTHPELANEFSDLLAWRDNLYAKHRQLASTVPTET